MDLPLETGETREHLELMRLLMCQSDQSSKTSKGNETTESQFIVVQPNCSGEENAKLFDQATPKVVTSSGFVTPLDTNTFNQPVPKEKPMFGVALEKNQQIHEENLNTKDSAFQNATALPKIDTLPVFCQVPQLEHLHFGLTQNLENVPNANTDFLQPFGIVNFEATDMVALDDPAFSALDHNLFDSGDMIASSENDIIQFNKMLQSEEEKPKKEKGVKKKSTEPKKLSINKKPEIPKLKEENVPQWAQAYHHMFKCQQVDFETEKQFNEKSSLKYPNCSICILFQPRIVTHELGNVQVLDNTAETKVPTKSTPLTLELYSGRIDATLAKQTKESVLLQCICCRICVHAFCYGEEEKNFEWMCSRCIKGELGATCCLCNLRGGALALTTKNRWCHIVCALLNTDTSFNDKIRIQDVDVSNIPKARKSLKCGYCSSFHGSPEVAGGIVQCTTGKCRSAFHVTCGYAAGVVYQPDTKHFPVFTMCLKHLEHSGNRKKGSKRELIEIQLGDKVIAQHKNGRYYKCEVIRIQDELFCKAAFDDGSLSTNLYPEDIQNYDIRKNGPPENDSSVQVLWRPTNEIYSAIFKGTHTVPYYDVRFEDGSQLDVYREDVYTLTEKLPQKVKSKLSEVTLSQPNTGENFNSKSRAGGKRSRQPNPLYFGSTFVEK